MSQWVQHISGQGEKWQVHNETFALSSDAWCVRASLGGYHHLPKSEYILVEPDKAWEDVTSECVIEREQYLVPPGKGGWKVRNVLKVPDGFRLRFVVIPAWEPNSQRFGERHFLTVERLQS